MNATPRGETPDRGRTALDRLLDRNEDHAAGHDGVTPALEPSLRAVVLACADHRADPAHVLGLAPNEAVVVRNPGGRVTESFVNSLVVLATVASIEGLGPGFELIVMHHTDCGLSRLGGERHAGLLGAMFGDVGSSRHTVTDPMVTVDEDIDSLRRNPFVPDTLVVSGLVYEVESGRAHTVVAPAPLSSGGRT
ncbi:MAG TPA: carbonic anhydrase [Iamia sp.]